MTCSQQRKEKLEGYTRAFGIGDGVETIVSTSFVFGAEVGG